MAKTKKNIAKKKKKKQTQAQPEVAAQETVQADLSDKEQKKAAKAEEKAQKQADKEFEEKRKAKEKEKNPGFFARMGNFFKGTWAELKKVQWLSSDELMKASGAVAGIVTAFTLVTWAADSLLGTIAAFILNI
ncbi:MAG: preprotein translocase subunit SecE [Eubacteriaceae bacterium]|jgi:preprotein translocase subunit SecE